MSRLKTIWHYLATVILLLALVGCSSTDDSTTGTNKPVPNPYLSSSVYGMTHFDSSQSDSTPYGPPRGVYRVDPSAQPITFGGPISIVTLDATDPDYMWQVSYDRGGYVSKSSGKWAAVTRYEALAEASGGSLPVVPDANFKTLGEATAVGMTPDIMDTQFESLFGANYALRFGNGVYVLVDNNNVVYTNYLDSLYAFALVDPKNPASGIKILYRLDGVISKLQAGFPAPPAGTRLFGISMSYDGKLIITFSNGVAILDRTLNPDTKKFYRFADEEYVSNSIAVDEKNGIYVATGPNFKMASSITAPKSIMRKLVWTGSAISDSAGDGAWSAVYDNLFPELPPLIKLGYGTGSTPTLMGFGSDSDKLVVITDGAKSMKLVAFWRDTIPTGFSNRIAGQIKVTCGFTKDPEWLQSEQSVVVFGYGAFVVNNLPQTYTSAIQSANKYVQVALVGPAAETSFGVERFRWDPATHAWSSVWSRNDVSSTSMVPIHSGSGNMALINGYRPNFGWEVLGLDWNTGATVHQTLFGTRNYGNGAYAILQYLSSGDLLFNSLVGPMRVTYGN